MASIINSDDGVISGTSGLKTTGGNDGITTFQQNGTEVMRLDSSANLKFNSGYGSVATAYGCRAWVNFNGTGTVAINASGNVTSITDNGTGDYTVNFTTALPDTNYCWATGSTHGSGQVAPRILSYQDGTKTTTAFQVLCEATSDGSNVDNNNLCLTIHR